MPKTYEKIQTQSLSTANANITFSNIPGSFTDLVVIGAVNAAAASEVSIRFNSDTGNNYHNIWQSSTSTAGNISGDFTTGISKMYMSWHSGSSNVSWVGLVANVFNYANSSTYKPVLARFGGENETTFVVGNWSSTSSITSLTVNGSTNFSAGSIFTLYGIKAA